jgi:Cu2+-containing amine oxidase
MPEKNRLARERKREMNRVVWSGLIVLCAVMSNEPAFAETESEHVNWGRWSFDWEVRDNTGLSLRDVTYADEPVLAKVSMPVIRVKYVNEMV